MPHRQHAVLGIEINKLWGEKSELKMEGVRKSSCNGMLADGIAGSCWNLPKGLCLKKKKKPLSDLSTEAGREGWGLAWLLSSCWSEVLLPHTVWGSMNTDTFWDLCPLPVTNCNSGIKTKNLIAADRDFFFVCVCSWQLSSQLFLCCTAQQLSQSNCVSNNIAENSWSVKTYGTPCVLLVPSVLFNWPPSSNFLAPILYKCMIFPSWIAGERMRILSAALEPGAQAGVLKLAGLGG